MKRNSRQQESYFSPYSIPIIRFCSNSCLFLHLFQDEKLQDVLGHFQKDFEGGVSAENLGEEVFLWSD
jgi:hypothetical protein